MAYGLCEAKFHSFERKVSRRSNGQTLCQQCWNEIKEERKKPKVIKLRGEMVDVSPELKSNILTLTEANQIITLIQKEITNYWNNYMKLDTDTTKNSAKLEAQDTLYEIQKIIKGA